MGCCSPDQIGVDRRPAKHLKIGLSLELPQVRSFAKAWDAALNGLAASGLPEAADQGRQGSCRCSTEGSDTCTSATGPDAEGQGHAPGGEAEAVGGFRGTARVSSGSTTPSGVVFHPWDSGIHPIFGSPQVENLRDCGRLWPGV
jgi:hypothetical protein